MIIMKIQNKMNSKKRLQISKRKYKKRNLLTTMLDKHHGGQVRFKLFKD